MIQMIEIENECVGCPGELGCIGNSCRYMNVVRFYCDGCGEEKQLYYWDGIELCIDCIEHKLERVEYDEREE